MIIKAIIANLLLLSSQIIALETTHLIRPNSTFESSILNSSCSTMYDKKFSRQCNYALYPFTDKQGITLSLMGKSDGDSIDNGRDLIFDPITETLLRKLFEETSFNSFTANTSVSFSNNLFEISYTPYYLLADLYLFNPAFPEISLNLINRESLRLSSGLLIYGSGNLDEDINLSLGFSSYYYSHSSSNTIFSIFDLSNQEPEDLITFKDTKGIAGDLSLFLAIPNKLIPNIALQIKNINSEVKTSDSKISSSVLLDTRYLFETYMKVGLGETFNTFYGSLSYNLDIPINGYFEEASISDSTFSLYYTLRLVSFLFSINDNYQNIGLTFSSDNFDVGISYNREKDIAEIQNEYENSAYIGFSISL